MLPAPGVSRRKGVLPASICTAGPSPHDPWDDKRDLGLQNIPDYIVGGKVKSFTETMLVSDLDPMAEALVQSGRLAPPRFRGRKLSFDRPGMLLAKRAWPEFKLDDEEQEDLAEVMACRWVTLCCAAWLSSTMHLHMHTETWQSLLMPAEWDLSWP